MKTCPFCAESIQDAAVKCRYCGEFLDGRRPAPARGWTDNYILLLLAVVLIGPFALPLLWRNRRLRNEVKAVLTAVILAFTVWLTWYTFHLYTAVINELTRPNMQLFSH